MSDEPIEGESPPDGQVNFLEEPEECPRCEDSTGFQVVVMFGGSGGQPGRDADHARIQCRECGVMMMPEEIPDIFEE